MISQALRLPSSKFIPLVAHKYPRKLCNNSSFAISSAATFLMTEVLGHLHEVERPVVQFIPACIESANGQAVVRQFAVAAVARLRRVLLITPWERSEEKNTTALPSARRLAQLLGRPADPTTPDTSVPGLYHRRLRDDEATDLAPWQDDVVGVEDFSLTVAFCRPTVISGASLLMAKRCHGSVLMVAAGRTRRDEIDVTARQITRAGGTVLGAILLDAPSNAWLGRRWSA